MKRNLNDPVRLAQPNDSLVLKFTAVIFISQVFFPVCY